MTIAPTTPNANNSFPFGTANTCSVVGDYELRFSVVTPFTFPGAA